MNTLKHFFQDLYYKLGKFRKVIAPVLILIIIPITILVLQYTQIFRSHAATTPGSYGYGAFGEGVYGTSIIATPSATITPVVTVTPTISVTPTVTPLLTTTPTLTSIPTISTGSKTNTTSTLFSSPPTSSYGQSVSFISRVQPYTCTGSVSLFIDGVFNQSKVLSSGTVIYSMSTLPRGSHIVRTDYAGSSVCNTSSSTITQRVN
ncbi:MAG TPA: Ig-like domain repeat protein [Candidatus Saccharimonadales bacterium]|nr:Ig-like domain repeat protein [Candidatus Saccharimonadales bacterium]